MREKLSRNKWRVTAIHKEDAYYEDFPMIKKWEIRSARLNRWKKTGWYSGDIVFLEHGDFYFYLIKTSKQRKGVL